MDKAKRGKGFSAFLFDISYSYPFLREFLSFFITFSHELFKQISPPIGPKEAPHPISRFDILMANLNYMLVNGFLLSIPFSILLHVPYRVEYIFGLGVGYFMAKDLLENLLWKPMRGVMRSFKLK